MSDARENDGGVAYILLWMSLAIFFSLVLIVNPYEVSITNIILGAVVTTLSVIPISKWLRNYTERTIPLLPLHFVFYAVGFGISGVIRPLYSISGGSISEVEYSLGLVAAAISLAALSVGYYFGKSVYFKGPGRFFEKIPRLPVEYLITFYLFAVGVELIAREAEFADLNNILNPIRLFTFICLLFEVLQGGATRTLRIVAVALIFPIELIIYSGLFRGFLIGIVTYGYFFFISYVVKRGRVPILFPILLVGAFLVLQPAKDAFRQVAWASGAQSAYIEPQVYLEGLREAFLVDSNVGDFSVRDWLDSTVRRINHLQTLSFVIADTSAEHYKYGETLIPLFTKLIPRFLWPEKPIEDLGNRWAHEYGFLDREDFFTAFNLPWLPEMFINFGWIGVVGISALLGALMGLLWRSLLVGATSQTQYSFSLVIVSPFFFPESNISGMIGSILISGVILVAFLTIFRVRNTLI